MELQGPLTVGAAEFWEGVVLQADGCCLHLFPLSVLNG